MKALVIDRPGEASIHDVPEPQSGPGEALLRVRRIGLCGSGTSWIEASPGRSMTSAFICSSLALFSSSFEVFAWTQSD